MNHGPSVNRDTEPIDVIVMVARDEFFPLLKALAMANRDGYDLETIGIAFAQSYFDEDDLPQDDEGSENAREFYSPYDWDEEDDDDLGDL